jgi:vitamin-K-epoxide reductase (warfarin-sensitive)
MRWLIAVVAIAGFVAASLALREHYRQEASPCSINEKWDCGTVNKSRFATIGGLVASRGPQDAPPPGAKKSLLERIGDIPVAVVGIGGYLLLAVLAIGKRWRLLAAAAVPALAFSLYLAHIEKDILEVWCIYCVISLGAITLVTLLSIVALVMDLRGKRELPGESAA